MPVPWDNFKVTARASPLALDTTKSVLDVGTRVSHEQFATPGQFNQQSQRVDTYWKTHLSSRDDGKPPD